MDEARHTTPGTTFDANLKRFVEETKQKEGIPVLFNSIVRRNFNEDGVLIDTHGEYLKSPENVAKELNVIFIDLNKLTHNLVQEIGDEQSKRLYMWVGDKQDNTHLNMNGAYKVAELAVKALAEKVPELLQYIR
jgi:pectinesterase